MLQAGLPVRVSAQGFSALAIWIEPNVGEGFRPLAKIASGGELSRLMLAMQGAGMALGAGSGEPLVLVLDEVDAGIGGETAIAVGAAVRELGRRHQVLAVTHLAQVAARAQHHGQLRKEVQEGRTRSGLTWLPGTPGHRNWPGSCPAIPTAPKPSPTPASSWTGGKVQYSPLDWGGFRPS